MAKKENLDVKKVYENLKGQEISLFKKFKIEFVSEYLGFSKGDKQEVSEFAYNLYVKSLKVAKELR